MTLHNFGLMVVGEKTVAPYPPQKVVSTGNFFIRSTATEENTVMEVMQQKPEQNSSVIIKKNEETNNRVKRFD